MALEAEKSSKGQTQRLSESNTQILRSLKPPKWDSAQQISSSNKSVKNKNAKNTPRSGQKTRSGPMSMSTSRGRRCNNIFILALATIPIVVLLIQSSYSLYQQTQRMHDQEDVMEDIKYTVLIGDLLHATQIERGTTVLFRGTQDKSKVLQRLHVSFKATDAALGNLPRWISNPEVPHFASKESYRERLEKFRNRNKLMSSDYAMNPTVKEILEFYNNDNAVIQKWIAKTIRSSKDSYTWRKLVCYDLLVNGKEQTSVERGTGVEFFTENATYSGPQMNEYVKRKSLSEAFLQEAKLYQDSVKEYLDHNETAVLKLETVNMLRKIILDNTNYLEDDSKATVWLEGMTEYIDVLQDVQNRLVGDILQTLEDSHRSLESAVVQKVIIMVVILVLWPLVTFGIYRLANRIGKYAGSLRDISSELDAERRQSELLLYQMLPKCVAQQLLLDQTVECVHYSAVSIYFSDIVGFSWIISICTPDQVIDILNTLYDMFDDVISKYQVYHVETVGKSDMYMVASGLPKENIFGHAIEMAAMALHMRDNVNNLSLLHIPDEKLQLRINSGMQFAIAEEKLRMRIGIHSGPVVTGVIGRKMPRYCLFGDTVNIAANMEHTGKPQHIHVSEDFKRELDKRGGFKVELSGELEIKGKNKLMTTYWLVDRSPKSLPNLDSKYRVHSTSL